jgi:hypothetical protein
MFPAFLAESRHYEERPMTERGRYHLTSYAVPHIEPTLCAQGDRSDQGLGAVDEFIVRVPAKVVISISVVVH